MIELARHGKVVRFDDTGVDRAQPGGVRRCLYDGCFYEERFLEHIRSLGKSGLYLDIGAYIGTHTLFFAVLCEATAVYAFEPRPALFDELQRNVRANELEDKVTLFNIGLASESKTVTGEQNGDIAEFECTPLDQILNDEIVTVVKMDVEGMELDILTGAKRMLGRCKPVIFAEAHEGEEWRAIEAYLREFGYVWSGRVFNRSPTYEFYHVDDDLVREVFETTVRQRERRITVASRFEKKVLQLEAAATRAEADLEAAAARAEADREARQELERETARLRDTNNELLRLLAVARGSVAFRLGRATRVALREASRAPWTIPRRWLGAFQQPDEILDRAKRQSESD